MKLSPVLLCSVAVWTFGSVSDSILAQGSLTPPGPPAPSMKTLAQIEPRLPIASLPFTITNAGSYYLTGNLIGVAGQNGVTVQADNVTFDLGGFSVSGPPGALKGIVVNGSHKNFLLRNGMINGWSAGVDAATCSAGIFEALRISDNTGPGLICGQNAAIRDCAAHSNGGSGIVADRGSQLKDCTARGNQAHGITADTGSQLTACTSSGNTGNGVVTGDSCVLRSCVAFGNSAAGVVAGADNVIEDCSTLSNITIGLQTGRGATVKSSTARSNGTDGIRVGIAAKVSNCTSSFNTQAGFNIGASSQLSGCSAAENKGSGVVGEDDVNILQCAASRNALLGFSTGNDAHILDCKAQSNGTGILAGKRSTVRGCAANGNGSDGITVSSECTVVGNDCKNNFNARDAAGIRAVSVDNCIKENTVVSNDRGIFVEGLGNLVIRNQAANNTLNYSFLTTQMAAPVVTNPEDANFVHPWANLQY